MFYVGKTRKKVALQPQEAKRIINSEENSTEDAKQMISEPADDRESTYVIVSSIEICDGQYGEWKGDRKGNLVFRRYGSAVYLDKVYIDIGTFGRKFLLSFKDSYGMTVKSYFDRKDLTDTAIGKFLEIGCQVTKKTFQALVTSIMNQEPEAPRELIHKKLGFSTFEDKRVFLGETGINVDSKYNGELKIQSCGNYSEWREMVKNEVIGQTPLEFILAVACTAPLVDYFREEYHTGNILISMASESSNGKTTAGCFAVSTGAKSSFEGDSMITTFADTPNAIMHSIHSSYPMLIDEGSLIQKNPTGLLYSLAQGKEKGRLTKELEKAGAITFSTTIFMTSEKSILRLCDSNTGLFVRCIEVRNVTWTKSADSADRIKKVCENHYGHLIWRIADKLLEYEKKQTIDVLCRKHEAIQQALIRNAKERGKYNPLTERFSKSAALILLGAELASEVLELQLDTKKIQEFIEEHSQVYTSENIDIGVRALAYACQYISINYSKFIIYNSDDAGIAPNDCKGMIKRMRPKNIANGKNASMEIFMTDIIFSEMMSKGDFPKEIVLEKWKAEGILHCQKDRFLGDNVVIGNTGKVKGYRFYVVHEYMEIIDRGRDSN